jgi:hypothetical protein
MTHTTALQLYQPSFYSPIRNGIHIREDRTREVVENLLQT